MTYTYLHHIQRGVFKCGVCSYFFAIKRDIQCPMCQHVWLTAGSEEASAVLALLRLEAWNDIQGLLDECTAREVDTWNWAVKENYGRKSK